MKEKIKSKWLEALISALIAFLTALGASSCTNLLVS